jgi:hypothetical protein
LGYNRCSRRDIEALLEGRKRRRIRILFMKTIMQTVKYAFTEKGNELTKPKLVH